MAVPSSSPVGGGGMRHQLVCGRCERILEEVHRDRVLADQAADQHAMREHGDEEGTVVLALPVHILADKPDHAVAIAVEAQADAEARRGDG